MACKSKTLTSWVIRTRIDAPLRQALDSVASDGGQTRSAVVRAALVSDLTRRGLWPPKASPDAK